MNDSAAAAPAGALQYQEDIPPFWTKLSYFFGYPFRFGPLAVIGILSLASVLSAFVGGLFRGLIAYLFLRYAFSVMEQAAQGDFNDESPDISMWGGSDKRPQKQAIVFLFFLAILWGLATISEQPVPPTPEAVAAVEVAQKQRAALVLKAQAAEEAEDDEAFQAARAQLDAIDTTRIEATEPETKLPWWFYVLAVMCALPLPGAVMVIAVEDNLVRALNPVTAFNYIAAMGSTYFVLWVFFAAIMFARDAVVRLTVDMSAMVRYPLETFATSYLTLALFVMMGYCLYQFHKELGYEVRNDFDTHREKEAATSKGARPVDPMTQQVNALLKEGKLDDAFRVVQDAMRYDKLNPELNDRLHALWLLKADHAKTLAHGQQYLKALLEAKKGARALEILKKLRAMDVGFAPEPDLLLGLAQAAAAARDYPQAMALVNGFDKKHPGHGDIPGVYFLGARICSEHLRQDEKAIKILTVLLQRYPECGVKAEATQYLAVLKSLAQPAKAVVTPAGA